MEADLNALHYNGESKKWTFEKYVNRMVELHNVSEDLKAHGYAGMDETSRVRRLLTGIRTDKLNIVKSQVLANPDLSCNFERTVNLFKDYIAQTKSLQSSSGNSASIAGVHADSKKKKGTDGKDNKKWDHAQISQVKVQDRYYTKEEYNKLSKEEKKALHEMRKKRKGDSSVSSVEARIAALETQVASAKIDDDSSVKSDQQATPSVSNRNNPALERTAPRRN
ncbi:MAG TPA: hypothetical protein VLS45_10470 [Methylomicrobium sp.]|nr:hypothetical protein [Methylomicrobium sp.]